MLKGVINHGAIASDGRTTQPPAAEEGGEAEDGPALLPACLKGAKKDRKGLEFRL